MELSIDNKSISQFTYVQFHLFRTKSPKPKVITPKKKGKVPTDWGTGKTNGKIDYSDGKSMVETEVAVTNEEEVSFIIFSTVK